MKPVVCCKTKLILPSLCSNDLVSVAHILNEAERGRCKKLDWEFGNISTLRTVNAELADMVIMVAEVCIKTRDFCL